MGQSLLAELGHAQRRPTRRQRSNHAAVHAVARAPNGHGWSYPLLFQKGRGRIWPPAVDAWYPHELNMELSAPRRRCSTSTGRLSVTPRSDPSPSTRASTMELPQATLAHHWQDSTTSLTTSSPWASGHRKAGLEGSVVRTRKWVVGTPHRAAHERQLHRHASDAAVGGDRGPCRRKNFFIEVYRRLSTPLSRHTGSPTTGGASTAAPPRVSLCSCACG
jgi:hypothetical protein